MFEVTALESEGDFEKNTRNSQILAFCLIPFECSPTLLSVIKICFDRYKTQAFLFLGKELERIET